MNEVSQRLEIVAARAAASVLAAHAHLSHALAARMADRIFPQRTIELYCDAHRLDGHDAAWIRLHALARMGLQSTAHAQAAEERRLRSGILRFQDWMRLHMAPHRDPALREVLQCELAYSRNYIIRLHARHALRFVEVAAPQRRAPEAVYMYLARLDVDSRIQAAVHAMALSKIAEQRRVLTPPKRAQRLPRRSQRGEPQRVEAQLVAH
jgi:hypothetical protein